MSTLFPKWTNQLPTILAIGMLGAGSVAVAGVWYYFTPEFWEVGYMPTQPGTGFPHNLHAGKLGMDCRYCHTHVEESPEANVPNVQVCYGCHQSGHVSDEVVAPVKVQFVRDAYEAGDRFDEIKGLAAAGKGAEAEAKRREYEAKELPVVEGGATIPWRRVHKLPDYVRNFPHNVHVHAGVSCYSCHGMIAREPVVHQEFALSMGWCLDCHRNPGPNLVPRDKVTDLFWVEAQLANAGNPPTSGGAGTVPAGPGLRREGSPGGEQLLRGLHEKPLVWLPEHCGACHY